MSMTRGQAWRLGFVATAMVMYLGLALAAPAADSSSPYQLPTTIMAVLSITIAGLFLLSWWFGYYAWLSLDRYTQLLPEEGRRTFGRMATGIWFLASGLILSSVLSVAKPFFDADSVLAAAITTVNYYIILIFPFLGFMWLRVGSRYLAVSAQAIMSVRSKWVTVGPPVLLLALFYMVMGATNSAPETTALTSGPTGFLVLPISVILVVASWVLGLLAALNIERATHGGESARLVRPLTKLYNGILTVTGSFIILDALMSLGATRLQALPVEAAVALLYGFIAVVALGFWLVARSARELVASRAKGGG